MDEVEDDACPSLDIRGLTKRYGGFTAVESFDMEVARGEAMGLLGPNGAGKSTILKCVSGLQAPTGGTVLIGGIDSRKHKEAMAGVGCVIETPVPHPFLTPMETLEYVGRIHGMPTRDIRDRSREVLEDLRMWQWRDKKAGGFSKGMNQRVAIAAALLHDPEVVLLDEPTSGLDPRGMIEMRQILSDLVGRGTTMVISTHMLREASELCSSLTMICHGRKVASGSVDDLVRSRDKGPTLGIRTAKSITRAFMKDLEGLPRVSDVERTGESSVRIMFSGTLEQRAEIAELVRSHGLMLVSMDEPEDGLESLYMSLTEGEGASAE